MKNKSEKKKLDGNSFLLAVTIILFFVMYIVGIIMFGGRGFAKVQNFLNLFISNAGLIVVATGMTIVMITGGIDISVGSVVAMVCMMLAWMMERGNIGAFPAILIVLVTGCIFGLVQGFLVAYLKIQPFIVTLATMLMGRGLTYTLLKAQTKGPLPTSYTYIGAGFLPTMKIPFGNGTLDVVSIIVAGIATVLVIMAELKSINTKKKYGFSTNPLWQVIIKEAVILMIVWFFFYKLSRYNGIPFVLVIMGVLVGLYHFITSKTVAGRQIYALGGNAKAAKLSGINTEKVFFWVYTNMGILSAIAGIVLSARNASATPKAGDGFEMDAIASCYIGGAATSGGIGTIIGAVVGAFIMGILNNGMSLYGWSTDIQKIVKGAVLLGAVTVDLLSKRKKG